MNSKNLLNLVKSGQLKIESCNENEYQGLIHMGKTRLKDVYNEALSEESRFDLAYNAAHSFALAALRKKGYRPTSRYIVFQVLAYTLEVEQEVCRILNSCHNRRNVAEYEGHLEIDSELLNALVRIAQKLSDLVSSKSK